ncbi:FAD/NAD(P)-binding oxidoreductase family protein [Forsythia ovata]|uniref:FAD/NAD(P)-binding oxidoreductase family protein n=1 Tax=Forsythia ovata TaxID=205694 RepID=A0ABD1USE0_9LAMI
MVIHEPILIVGAGISGLSPALTLHKLGIQSLVLESLDHLRITGVALTMCTNAWKTLDALGIGDYLKTKSVQIHGFKPDLFKEIPRSKCEFVRFFGILTIGNSSRCMKRKDMLETLEKELPKGTIRYSSKVVSREESGNFKLVHLADSSVNPDGGGRTSIRGFINYPNGHGFEANFLAYFDTSVEDSVMASFLVMTRAYIGSAHDENKQNPFKIKQFVLSGIQNAPQQVSNIVERTELDYISYAPLKYRSPWYILQVAEA